MTVIDDLVSELGAYPDEQVEVQIRNFQEPGAVINPGEICTFEVRIRNNGHLDMLNVSLNINGVSGLTELSQTEILGNPVNFSTKLTTAPMTIGAHASATTQTFYMRALSATASTRLFEVHLADWDASLAKLLRVHAGHDFGARDELTRAIEPT